MTLPDNVSFPVDSEALDLDAVNYGVAQTLVPAMIYLAVLIVVGGIGNVLVIYVFTFRTKMSVQHFYFVVLATFDLVCCLVSMPTEIADMALYYKFQSEVACKLLRFIVVFTTLNSSIVLVAIAIDRYRKICLPTKKQVTIPIAKQSLVLIVGGAILFAWPTPVLYGVSTVNTGVGEVKGYDCTFSDAFSGTKIPFVYNSALFFGFIVEVIVLVVLYSLILCGLKRHASYIRNIMKSCRRSSASKISDQIDSVCSVSNESSGCGCNDDSSTQEHGSFPEKISASVKLLQLDVGELEIHHTVSPNTDENFITNAAEISSQGERDERAVSILSVSTINMSETLLSRTISELTQTTDISLSNLDFNQNTPPLSTSHVCNTTVTNTFKPAVSSNGQGQRRKPGHRIVTTKTTLIAFLVTVVYIISYLPHLCLQVAKLVYHIDDRKGPLVLYNIIIRSFFINSASNPVIYAALNIKFRSEIRKIFCRIFRFRRLR